MSLLLPLPLENFGPHVLKRAVLDLIFDKYPRYFDNDPDAGLPLGTCPYPSKDAFICKILWIFPENRLSSRDMITAPGSGTATMAISATSSPQTT
jgi:hypothetical protein